MSVLFAHRSRNTKGDSDLRQDGDEKHLPYM